MVPGNFGCGVAVLAAMVTFAPSLAHLIAMAFPIPRLAPVMNIVLPASFLQKIFAFVIQTTMYLKKAIVANSPRKLEEVGGVNTASGRSIL